TAWAVDPQFGKDHAAVFATAAPVGFPGGTVLTVTLEFKNNKGHGIGRPRLSLSTVNDPPVAAGSGMPQEAPRLLAPLDREPRTRLDEQQRTALLRWFRSRDPRWQELNTKREDHLRTAPQPTTTKVLVCSEGVPPLRMHSQGADFFEQTYFLKRGDTDQKDGVATQSFLQVLTRHPDQEKHWQVAPPKGWRPSYRRPALAGGITDAAPGAGHLLARVIVNRLWQHHMGRGLVATPSDFGTQGEPPSHPELLDWLAQELIKGGWRLKPIHKLIMTSAVYQQ